MKKLSQKDFDKYSISELLEFDLSDIPSSFYENKEFILDDIDLSKNKINLDFNIIDQNSTFQNVNFKNCHLENLEKSDCEFINISSDNFDESFVKENSHLFLTNPNIPNDVKVEAFCCGCLHLNDYRKYKDYINEEQLKFAIRSLYCEDYEQIEKIFGSIKNYVEIVDPLFDYKLKFDKMDRVESKKDFESYKNEDYIKLTKIESIEAIHEKYIKMNEILNKQEIRFIKYLGIDNLYEFTKQYPKVLNDFNFVKFTKIYDELYVKDIYKEDIEELKDQINYFNNKKALTSSNDVYEFLKLLFNYNRFNYSEVTLLTPFNFYLDELATAYPDDILTREEIFSIFQNDSFHSGNVRRTQKRFLLTNEVNEIFTTLREYSKIKELIKNKNIYFPNNNVFKLFQKYLSKEQLIDYFTNYYIDTVIELLNYKNIENYEKILKNNSVEDAMDLIIIDIVKHKLYQPNIYPLLPKEFRKKHKEVFIDTYGIIRDYYYQRKIDASFIRYYKNQDKLKEIFKDIDLGIFFVKGDTYNIYDLLKINFSNEEILDFMRDCPNIFIELSNLDKNLYVMFKDYNRKEMIDVLDKYATEVLNEDKDSWVFDRLSMPKTFIEKHSELYLDNKTVDEYLVKEFNDRNIQFKTFSVFDNGAEILADKSIGCFRIKSDREFIQFLLNKNIDKKKLYKFFELYSEVLNNYEFNDEKTKQELSTLFKNSKEDKIAILEKFIIDVVVNDVKSPDGYALDYSDEVLDRIAIYHPEIILGDEFTSYFKDNFYNKHLVFSDIEKVYIESLKKKDIEIEYFFSEDFQFLFEHYGRDKTLEIGVKYADVIDGLSPTNDLELFCNWYDKLHFVPSLTIMRILPIDYADKLLATGKKWTKLIHMLDKYKGYSFGLYNFEYTEAIIKAAVCFGVLDNDDKGYNLFMNLIFEMPEYLTLDEFKIINLSFLRENNKEPLKLLNNMYVKNKNNYKRILRNNYFDENYIYLKYCYDKSANKINKFHQIFGSFEFKYNSDFRDFFIKNYEELIEPNNITFIDKIQKQFKRIKTFNNGRGLSVKSAIDYVKSIKYADIDSSCYELSLLASKSGYNEEQFSKLKSIYNNTRLRITSQIPRVYGTYKNFSYEILRLDDPLALVIGELTDCCQALDDTAETSMIHSVTKDNGRVFVVRDNDNNIIAQSWIWREGNVMCFDNIEIPEKILYKMNDNNLASEVLKVYKKVANELLIKDQEYSKNLLEKNKNCNYIALNKITVGLGYNDIASIIKSRLKIDQNLVLINEYINSKKVYTDAKEQYILVENKNNSYNISNQFKAQFLDEVEIIDKDNITNNKIEVLSYVLKESKNDFLSSLADSYNIKIENIKILFNPNFCILCEDKNDIITIKDIIYDSDQKEEKIIYKQMEQYFSFLNDNSKKINIDRNSDNKNIYEKVMKLDIK